MATKIAVWLRFGCLVYCIHCHQQKCSLGTRFIPTYSSGDGWRSSLDKSVILNKCVMYWNYGSWPKRRIWTVAGLQCPMHDSIVKSHRTNDRRITSV